MNPAYEQAAAREAENRLLAYLERGRPLLGCPVVTLRWRHVLELQLAQNAFFTGRPAQPGDVYDLLWRLHPWFTTPDGRLPNLPDGARRPGIFLRLFAQWWLARHVRRLALARAERTVLLWLRDAYQDKPAESGDGAGESGYASAYAPRSSWFDEFSREFSAAQVMESGVAWSFQSLRARDLASGDPKRRARYVPPSAQLLTLDDPSAANIEPFPAATLP